jgi:glycosyltransferase involved in cell wall biosynthesis
MKTPQISVIMPVYNAEKYLDASIESVLNQTHNDYELLIIDDASTDKTAAIAQQYAQKDGRVRVLKNIYDKGVGGGINTGLENSKGEYIARADGDDINRPYRFELQVKYLDAHVDIFVLGGGYAPFNKNGHRMDIFHPSSSIEIAWKFVSDSFLCHPTVMFRKRIYEEFGGYPNAEAEDFVYFSKIVKKYKCANLKTILIDYRESLTNRSFSAAEKIKASVKKEFLANYYYYLGDTRDAHLFYDYQSKHYLRARNLWKVNSINWKILRKIARNYNLSVLSGEFWKVYFRILLGCLVKI